jgi:hypothetical protein
MSDLKIQLCATQILTLCILHELVTTSHLWVQINVVRFLISKGTFGLDFNFIIIIIKFNIEFDFQISTLIVQDRYHVI